MLSTKRNAPRALFGRSRAQRGGSGSRGSSPAPSSVASLAPSASLLAPGPGEYPGARVPACSAKQVDSRKRTHAGFRFGTASKDPLAQPSRLDCGPPEGNQLYVLPSAICVQGKGSPYRAAPAFSLSGHERFRAPF